MSFLHSGIFHCILKDKQTFIRHESRSSMDTYRTATSDQRLLVCHPLPDSVHRHTSILEIDSKRLCLILDYAIHTGEKQVDRQSRAFAVTDTHVANIDTIPKEINNDRCSGHTLGKRHRCIVRSDIIPRHSVRIGNWNTSRNMKIDTCVHPFHWNEIQAWMYQTDSTSLINTKYNRMVQWGMIDTTGST